MENKQGMVGLMVGGELLSARKIVLIGVGDDRKLMQVELGREVLGVEFLGIDQ